MMRSSFVKGAVAILAGCALALGVARADVKSGEKALKDAVKKPDNHAAVQEACDELLKAGGKEAVVPILKLIPALVDQREYYSQLCGAAAGFQDKSALEEVGSFVLSNKDKPWGKDVFVNLQNNSSQYSIVPRRMVLEKGTYELQLAAIDQVGTGPRSIEAVDALIEALGREKKDERVRKALDQALQAMTFQNVGLESWESWWQQQKPKGLPDRPKKGEGGDKAGPGEAAPSGGSTVERKQKELEGGDAKGVVVISHVQKKGEKGKDGQQLKPSGQDYDHLGQVLEGLRIKYTEVAQDEFEADPSAILKSAYAVLVNCGNCSPHCICPTCKPGGDLHNRMMTCTGCDKHVPFDPKLKQPAVDALKAWVEAGGYLFTEDMGMIDITGRAWPDKLSTHDVDAKNPPNTVGMDGKPLPKMKPLLVRPNGTKGGPGQVHLLPAPGSTTHPLMRGVWSRPKTDAEKAEEDAKRGGNEGGGGTVEKKESPAKLLDHKWTIDDESPCFHIADPKGVVVLFTSEELGKMSEGETAVAVTFKVGKGGGGNRQATGSGGKGGVEFSSGGGGRVLHTMSHFGKQDASQDGQALLNLMLNFLLEAKKAHEDRGGKAK